jgi:predicted short-subunit dehydrogenase-like oxidoreductase (DUF2520 family)
MTLPATTPQTPSLGIVGAGRAGLAVALGLVAAGAPPARIVVRDPQRAAAIAALLPSSVAVDTDTSPLWAQLDVVVFATPDRALAAAASALASVYAAVAADSGANVTWLHLSGVTPPAALHCPDGAHHLGSCHPLAAISDAVALTQAHGADVAAQEAVDALRGACFAVAGDECALGVAVWLAGRLGGAAVEVPLDDRHAWHAAAALVANDLVALLALAERLALRAGAPLAAVRPGLLHLARSSLRSVELATASPTGGLVDGLTGAVARGDAATLSQHLRALASDPLGAAAHRTLSAVLLEMVRAQPGRDPALIAAIERAIATETSKID